MKKGNETYLEYKARVIDKISDSFCAAKWLNSTIWLAPGRTTSCHHPEAHQINKDELKENPTAIHNTEHKKLMRKMMLEGKRPPECEYCWKIEDISKKNVSDRVFKTIIYDDAKIKEIAEQPWDKDVDLETLEIAFDRTCNFACSYCNASFSTTWLNDIKKNGIYANLKSDGQIAYTHTGGVWTEFKPKEENPFVRAFWQWWPRLSTTLKELRITGGEPLLSPELWKLLDMFETQQITTRLAINSNLGSPEKVINKFIEKSQNIKNLELYTSCEAHGEHAEYIRDGLKWDLFKSNFENVASNAKVNSIGMMMTIHSLSLYSMTDFMDLVLDWKSKFGYTKPTMSFNILRFPSFMSAASLPSELKNERRNHLINWFERNKNNQYLLDFEKASLKRLIDYLEVVESPHKRASENKILWHDFKSFYSQYDKRRGKDFTKTFPKLVVDWYNSIKIDEPLRDLAL
ncbi:MAG: twitch domain-containing radical SAM protein [Oligoflexia bacterium]|nr:twitch domain-containing radical SAM protein [Oligoflexia bacterium]